MASSAAEGIIENSDEPAVTDNGAACLAMILAINGHRANPEQIAHEFVGREGRVDAIGIVRGARAAGFKARRITARWERFQKLPLPAIAELDDGSFVLLAKVDEDRALVQTPGKPPNEIARAEFEEHYAGHVILVAKRAADMVSDVKFGLRWFLPVIAKYKSHFSEVLLASFFLQSFGLITPLFFQVVIDKVLVHRGLTTLDVLIVGLAGITIFEVLLGWLRTYLFSHTTSRVDVQLGSQLFRHLLDLPISYFESRPTGQTVARVRELENVRDFITSSALTVLIDMSFAIVFFAVMWLFSPTLTLIVMASIPFYVLISLLITPALRERVKERFYRGAANQAFLVESIAGAETLKSMAVEPQMRAHWDENLAAYVKASFRAITLGATGQQLVMLVNKLTTAAVLWFGARLAISGELTVGQLVAFNMLAGQVSQPIIRVAQLWQDFQQFRISIERLGDILNLPPEAKNTSAPESLPPLKGEIEFKNVTFRYRPGEVEVLRDLSFKIEPGTTVGIVGRSGSGKSTVTKLIQRLHVPEQGRVLLDGMDTRLLDPAWMRRQIGVVLQDNILFNRSVRDNIALSDPAMSMKRVMQAASLSGAHEFILQLSMGYDTILEERGSNLSGGQRQRIAIARAIAIKPRILILDEATAALDYESERLFQQNLQKIAVGRTIVVIAHRLSTVRHADKIMVMEEGKLVEAGSHDELAARNGAYASLLKMGQ